MRVKSRWFAACYEEGMRQPYDAKGTESQSTNASSVGRDPSYPDRARIDSDVRAFLRPVSTPWIVFDRDSRVESPIDGIAKSALRVGAVFASNPSFRPDVIVTEASTGVGDEIALAQTVADPFRPGGVLAQARSSVLATAGVFPQSPAAPEAPEPSSLVVATDVSDAIAEADLAPLRARGRLAKVVGALGGCAVAAAVLATLSLHKPEPVAPAAAALAAPPAAEITPPPAEVAVAPVIELPANEPASVKTTDPKKRFGKLTLKGDASRKLVWFDGKKMLGSGQRTFLVFCGMHTVAVSDKGESKDIDIPCNGEYVVGK
jgi:hypothetical protein